MECSVEGCAKPVLARWVCGTHYAYMKRHGTLPPPMIRGMQPDICKIDGCNKRATARGWCPMHYQRWRRFGTTDDLPVRIGVVEAFWLLVDKTDTCWTWTGPTARGYGRYYDRRDDRRYMAHRWAYEHLVGTIPPSLQLDHLCRNSLCVNPEHLEPVTAKENNSRSRSPSAVNATKTQCKWGHEFTPENTYVPPGTRKRHCRTCAKIANQRHSAKRL
jgi:hypothetical protein